MGFSQPYRRQAGGFAVIEGEIEGQPPVAIIDKDLVGFKDRSKLPWFLSLSTPLVDPAASGLPTREDQADLNEWEDRVEKELEGAVQFAFVGRVTWKGNRELLYYVSDSAAPMKRLRSLADARSTRPFALRCEEDEEWEAANFWFGQLRTK